MPEESYSFTQARLRLEEIVTQVRKKDVSLETSLDLLEEGVRLANQCTELIDSADWEAAGLAGEAGGEASDAEADSDARSAADADAEARPGTDADLEADVQAEPADFDEV